MSSTTNDPAVEKVHVEGEGVFAEAAPGEVAETAEPATAVPPPFRYSRLGPRGKRLAVGTLQALADVLVDPHGRSAATAIPAAYTYVGQFLEHDLTFDVTDPGSFGKDIELEAAASVRTPSLDLDTLYGPAPGQPPFYDGNRLVIGAAQAADFPPRDPVASKDLPGCDLARGLPDPKLPPGFARIPDPRDDTNLTLAQLHVAFIRFHNTIVADLERAGGGGDVLAKAREEVVRHYQWMIREDVLPRLCDRTVVDDVFARPAPTVAANAPMAAEFAMAAGRFGHSMVRATYEWNRIFETGGPGGIATIAQLMNLTGTVGTLTAEGDRNHLGTRLPSSWVIDWRRFVDFGADARRHDLAPPPGKLNFAELINSWITPPLATLPPPFLAILGGVMRNLAQRNLIRARMIALASGQQMAAHYNVTPLTRDEILEGKNGVVLTALSPAQRDELAADTPLWFYILREAEVRAAGQHLGPVGSRIIVETVHRAMAASKTSILREPQWKPTRGASGKFTLAHLLLAGSADQINPLGS